MQKKTAIFLNTCDKNQDVCEYFLTAFDRYWKDNQLIKIAGTNKLDINLKKHGFYIVSSKPTNWKQETISQLKEVKCKFPDISYVLLFLDDFILNKKVDNERILEILNNLNNEKYIRLKVVEEGLFMKINNFFSKRKLWRNSKGIEIRDSHPYYSSLQVAIWDIDYLIFCVENSMSIWDFETPKPYHSKHYAVTKNYFSYRHIVEKGEWDVGVENYCKKYVDFFNRGNRPQKKRKLIDSIILSIKNILFKLFGYMFMKIRKRINLRA